MFGATEIRHIFFSFSFLGTSFVKLFFTRFAKLVVSLLTAKYFFGQYFLLCPFSYTSILIMHFNNLVLLIVKHILLPSPMNPISVCPLSCKDADFTSCIL